MFLYGVEGVQRLKLQFHCKLVSVLQCIPVPSNMKLDITVDVSDAASHIVAMHDVLESMATYGRAGMLETLRLSQSGRQLSPMLSSVLPSVLSACHRLISLHLDLLFVQSATEWEPILTVVARDLIHLVAFTVVSGSSPSVDIPMVAPCIQFAQRDRVLQHLCVDFREVDLTDKAAALLIDVAVQRCMHNPRNTTVLRMEGSSIGDQALRSLSASAAFPGCKFHLYDSKPMSPAVLLHKNLHHPLRLH